MSSTVGGSTPSNSRIANHTLANCLTSKAVTPDTALATNTTTMTKTQYKKIVKGELEIINLLSLPSYYAFENYLFNSFQLLISWKT